MLNFIHLIIGFLIIILISPQTPTENIVLQKFLKTGIFTNYSEAKGVLNFSTWFLTFLFLVLTFFLNLKF